MYATVASQSQAYAQRAKNAAETKSTFGVKEPLLLAPPSEPTYPSSAVILCGGQGLRLRPITAKEPKWLTKVTDDESISDFQLEWLSKNGVWNVILACGYKWGKIRRKYGVTHKTKYGNIQLFYSVEPVNSPLGTLGALKKAVTENRLYEGFFVVNGDNVSDVSLKRLYEYGSKHISWPTVTFSQYKCPYGVLTESEGGASYLREKPVLQNVWVNAGIYYLTAGLLRDRGTSIEETLFKKGVIPYKHNGYWKTVDSLKDLKEVRDWFEWKNRK